MAVFEKAVEGLVEGGAVTGAAVGLGVLLLVPGLLPAVGRALRPLAVGAVRTGITVYNQAATTVREATDDIIAEARAEIDAANQGQGEPVRRRTRAHESAA
ncbi:MAG TPA: DUF5132 domain-containing protein [Stellaceae bacterium]|nr:DUF5132 domain-containing protein [Stellaceae bacterium]